MLKVNKHLYKVDKTIINKDIKVIVKIVKD